MKTLGIPSSGIVVGDTKLSLHRDLLVLKPETTCFRRSHKLVRAGFLHLSSATHRNDNQPIFCLSSNPLVDSNTESQEINQSKTVRVKFQIQRECSFGDEFLLVGDDPMFGLWDPDNGIPLTWSEGHVWTLEMDIPLGKTIQFKFILKESTGTVVWQPGPDRTFHSWETNNTITVCEAWEDAEQQQLLEDDGFPDQTEDSSVNAAVENLTSPKEELVSEINNGSVDNNSYPAETPEELLFTGSISSQEVKPVAIVADNIGNTKKDYVVNSASEVLGNRRSGHAKKENVAIPKKDKVIAKGDLGQNGRLAAVKSGSTDVDENQITWEGGPVLVPGLSSFSSAVTTEEAVQAEGERSSSSVGVLDAPNDANGSDVPEFVTLELDKKQELDGDTDTRQQEPAEPFSKEDSPEHPLLAQGDQELANEEEHQDKPKQQPLIAEEEEEGSSEAINKEVFVNDMQWGRRTLQKLLANLGLG